MSLSVIQFEAKEIRMVGTAENPEWVAADVCKVLGIDLPANVIRSFSQTERGVCIVYIDPQQGEKEMLTVTEPGLYRLIFKSRKPEAERFRNWVTHEVLPSIRQHGCYPPPKVSTTSTALISLDPHELCIQMGKAIHDAVFSATDSRFTNVETKVDELSQDVRGIKQEIEQISQRKRIPDKTRRFHQHVVQIYYHGHCPCCQKTRIVNDAGEKKTNCEFDHWEKPSEVAVSKTWAVCRECNSKLRDSDWKSEKRVCFEAYQLRRREVKTAMDGPLLPGMED